MACTHENTVVFAPMPMAERQDRGQRQERCLDERSAGVPQILQECGHGNPHPLDGPRRTRCSRHRVDYAARFTRSKRKRRRARAEDSDPRRDRRRRRARSPPRPRRAAARDRPPPSARVYHWSPVPRPRRIGGSADARGFTSGGTSPASTIRPSHPPSAAARYAIATPCEKPTNTSGRRVRWSRSTARTTDHTYAVLSAISSSRSWLVIQQATIS